MTGLTFTVEPMITVGSWRHRLWHDGWTAVTADGERTAQFEHTVLITPSGPEVLTLPCRPCAPPPGCPPWSAGPPRGSGRVGCHQAGH
jgi:hypothetical protein